MAERGVYMGFVVFGTMTGPAIGPIIGGILSQFLGWRSIFWFLVILSAAFLVLYVVAFLGTGRHIVGSCSIPRQGWNRAAQDAEHPIMPETHGAKLGVKWPNPLKAVHIVMEKDVAIILIYNALVYTA